MTRWPGRGFKHMNQNTPHAYTECPEGKIIAIAKRDAVNTVDLKAITGLEWCAWCQAQDEIENPRFMCLSSRHRGH
jgi:hypothetical protein